MWRKYLLALSLGLFFLPASYCHEGFYHVTEEELTTLETLVEELQEISTGQEEELMKLTGQLETARKALAESDQAMNSLSLNLARLERSLSVSEREKGIWRAAAIATISYSVFTTLFLFFR